MMTNEEVIDVNNNGMDSSKETLAGKQSMLSNTTSVRLEKLYQIPKCKLPPASEMAAIEKFVENAIKSQEERASGRINKPDSSHLEGYNAILKALRRPNDPIMVCKVLLALRSAGHGAVLNSLALTDTHAQLLHLVIRFVSTMPPTFDDASASDPDAMRQVYKDYSLCDAHFSLLLAIVSAKSTHVIPILTAIWKLLTNYGPLEDEEVVHRIHSMIFNVLRLVPKANSDLYSIIQSKFPFWLRDKEILVWYANQSFKVLDYLPFIRRRIFGLLIDKCVEIDVNIFIKDNGDVTIDTTVNAPDDKDGKVTTDLNLMEDKSKSTTSVDILSDKLDALLDRILQQIKYDCGKGISSTRDTYHELFEVFESTILTTHKSKFVQYCIFLPCGLETQIIENSEHYFDNGYGQASSETVTTNESSDSAIEIKDEAILHRDFVSKLLQILVDPYRATTVRQSCACYLASFVSRASFVRADTVCESISALIRWAEAYIDSLGAHAVRATDARRQSDRHSLFYTVCQAAFYIMSFRGKEAIEFYRATLSKNSTIGVQNSEDDYFPDADCINLENKRWVFLCSHDLQPLRFCLESVRSEFLHVAHFYGLIDEAILNRLITDAKRLSTGKVNKKAASLISTSATLQRRRQTGGVGGMGQGSNPLKSFFPFDPLLLRQSHEFIEPFYKYWQGPVEEEDILVIDQVEIDRDPGFDIRDDESLSRSECYNSEFDNESDYEGNSDIYHSDALSEKEDSEMMTPDAHKIKLLQQKAWTETLKRPRSHSMENGSW
mmetsp:Transcript_18334/g.42249  ORF Transcript_18334/g.42249 Transcript_18334/m.42249 type:complete len:777 (+) Transcript_18334:92-2422(+)